MSDDWPDVVVFMKRTSERHKNVVYAKKATIFLDLNVDGIQMFKSGIRQAVPILARISSIVNDNGDFFIFSTMPVYLVGTYFGKEKPDCDELLEHAVEEFTHFHPGRDFCYQTAEVQCGLAPKRLKEYLVAQPKDGAPWPALTLNTFTAGIDLGLDRVITDGPARKDLTGTAGHAGFWSLPRCIQRGQHLVSTIDRQIRYSLPLYQAE